MPTVHAAHWHCAGECAVATVTAASAGYFGIYGDLPAGGPLDSEVTVSFKLVLA
jgi:hypothetical protein